MKKSKLKKWLIMLLVLNAILVNAQIVAEPQLVCSGGSFFSTHNYHFSWSIGELAVTTLDQGIILSQGFYQGSKSNSSFSNDPSFFFEIYPNPATELLIIRQDIAQKVIAEISDITGKKAGDFLLNYSPQEVNISHLMPGLYFLRIIHLGKVCGITRFIKL
jgi:hypothetical protein